MDEHRPKIRDISENAANAASAAATATAVAALAQSNGNTHEPHREAGDVLAGRRTQPATLSNTSRPQRVRRSPQWRKMLANMRETKPPRQPEALLRPTSGAGDRVSRYAAANPLTALLLAGAVGCGLGLFASPLATNPA